MALITSGRGRGSESYGQVGTADRLVAIVTLSLLGTIFTGCDFHTTQLFTHLCGSLIKCYILIVRDFFKRIVFFNYSQFVGMVTRTVRQFGLSTFDIIIIFYSWKCISSKDFNIALPIILQEVTSSGLEDNRSSCE